MDKGIIGKCKQMCPRSEIAVKKRLPSVFECDLNGNFREDYAIKEYNRSSAGKEIDDSEIRPLPVLIKTIDHIIHYVIEKKTNTSPETSEIQMYYFVGDRLRAIRTDITTQKLKGPEVIRILQISCLFFIWAGTRFHMEEEYVFDYKINIQQITQSILSLNDLYDSYYTDTHKHYPSEPFFRALDLISYLRYPGYMPKLLSYRDDIINSSYVQAVIEVKKAIIIRDVPLFLSVLNRVPVQMASYILQNSRVLWESIGYVLRRSFARFSFPLSYLTNYLQIPSDILEKWSQSFFLTKKPDQKNVSFDSKAQPDMLLMPYVFVPDIFICNQNFNHLLSFLDIEATIATFESCTPDESKIKAVTPENEPINLQLNEKEENDDERKKEIAQPAATKISNESSENGNLIEPETSQQLAVQNPKDELNNVQENIPMTPPEPDIEPEKKPINDQTGVSFFIDENNTNIKIPKYIPNRPNSTNPKLFQKNNRRVSINNKSISKKNLIIDHPGLFEAKISIKDIMAMIPYKVPRMSYACIILVADDGSTSSNFALDRFITRSGNENNSVILRQKLTNSSETCYILITKDQNQLGATSILDCNDTKDFEIKENYRFNSNSKGNISITKFNAVYGFSPALSFSTCLRTAIEKGITEIKPFNLSDLVQNTFSSFLRSISYTSWQFATANSVFKVLNMGLISISNLLIDDSFTRFILPFEYNELDFNELKKYSDKIKSMQFKLIDNSLSKRQINGSNWPSYIKERINTVFPPFIIPLSAKFNQNDFISSVMNELPLQEPSESIYYMQ